MLSKKPDNSEIYTCKFCAKQFKSASILNRHIASAKYCLNKRSVNLSTCHKCIHCSKEFTQRAAANRHQNTCATFIQNEKDKEEMRKKHDYTTELIKRDKMIQELEDKIEFEKSKHLVIIEQKDKYIKELEAEVNLNKGILEGINLNISNSKPHTIYNISSTQPPNINSNNTVTYNNPRVAALPIDHIQPLNLDLVKENLYKYTLQEFLRKDQGVIDFINNLIILDVEIEIPVQDISDNENSSIVPFIGISTLSQREYNYVCTDQSRNKYHILKAEKLWEQDAGAIFLKLIIKELGIYSQRHYTELGNKINNSSNSIEKERWVEKFHDIHEFYYGLLGNTKHSKKLFLAVKAGILEHVIL